MEQRRIPDIIGPQTLVTLTPRDCVHDAARLMAEHRISAILVVEGARLAGICTERDIVTRVVAADREPPTTPLAAVMTDPVSAVFSLAPSSPRKPSCRLAPPPVANRSIPIK